MTNNEVIRLLLNKSISFQQRIIQAVEEILRKQLTEDKTIEIVKDLCESITYTAEEIERIIKR